MEGHPDDPTRMELRNHQLRTDGKAGRLIRVVNMRTWDELYFDPRLTPEQALVAAYAHEQGDGNSWTWDKYRPLIEDGRSFLFLGDWAVRRPDQKGPSV